MVNRTANEWDGHIREFPKIKVDHFTGNALAFFLTHAHTDHLIGLDGENFRGVIYATHSTKQQVMRMTKRSGGGLKYDHLSRRATWRILEVNVPTVVREYQGDQCSTNLVVTALDANHCPGGVMFLLERGDTSVLVTGDTRAERWFVESTVRNRFLEKYTSGKQLGTIYADTTFSYREHDRFIEFPDNYESVSRMLGYLPKYRPRTFFMSYIPSTGMEMLICRLIDQLESIHGEVKVHLGKLYSKVYESMADVDPRARRIIDRMTHDPIEAQLHFCRKQDNCPVFDIPETVFLKPVIAMSPTLVDALNSWDEPLSQEYQEFLKSQEREERHFESSLETRLVRSEEDITQTRDGRVFIRGRQPQQKLPRILRFHFSRHSSYSEMRDLISRFKPKSVFPLWNNRIAFASGHTMKRLFREVCHPESRFDYDNEMLDGAGTLFESDSRILIPYFRRTPFVLRRELSAIYELWAQEEHKPVSTWDHISGFILRYLETGVGHTAWTNPEGSPVAPSSPVKQLDADDSDEEVACQSSVGGWNMSELLRLQHTTTSIDSSEALAKTQPIEDPSIHRTPPNSTTTKNEDDQKEKEMFSPILFGDADINTPSPHSPIVTIDDDEKVQGYEETVTAREKQLNTQKTLEDSDVELINVVVRSRPYRASDENTVGMISAPSEISKQPITPPSLIRRSVNRSHQGLQRSPTPIRKRALTELSTCSPSPVKHLRSTFVGSVDGSIEPFL